MNKLTFMAYNMLGLRSPEKRRAVIKRLFYLNHSGIPSPDIFSMQETHSIPQDNKSWPVELKYDLYMSHESNIGGGLLIGI